MWTAFICRVLTSGAALSVFCITAYVTIRMQPVMSSSKYSYIFQTNKCSFRQIYNLRLTILYFYTR